MFDAWEGSNEAENMAAKPSRKSANDDRFSTMFPGVSAGNSRRLLFAEKVKLSVMIVRIPHYCFSSRASRPGTSNGRG